MMISSKAYKIWKRLFDSPNEWISVPTLAYDVDMSSRQVSCRLKGMNSPYIERIPACGSHLPAVRLTVTDEEFDALRKEVIMSYNNLDEEMLETIRSTLSPIGWTTASDISILTGYRSSTICIALSIMDGVIQKSDGSSKMYSLA